MSRWLIAVSLLCVATLNFAASPAAPPTASPEAEAAAKRMISFFQGLQSFRVEAAATMRYGGKPEKGTITFAMEQPNKVAAVSSLGVFGGILASDGKMLTVVAGLLDRYSRADAPATLAEVLKDKNASYSGGPAFALLRVLLGASRDGAKHAPSWMRAPGNWSMVGTERIAGAACTRLRLAHEQVDWDLWIEQGDTPLVRKAVLDFSRVPVPKSDSNTTPTRGNESPQFIFEFAAWQVNGEVPAKTFAISPPKNAEEVGSLAYEPEEPAHPMLGKRAPDFDVSLLDGGNADLASHIGKEIVILDFWATWCGPCVRALPIVSGVAAEYKSKGVAFFAMNQREQPEAIRPFLERAGLKIAVALDKNGSVGEAYGVEGIPQTVIIDKTGQIAAVHVGFAEDMRARLVRDIEALLAGLAIHRTAAKEPEVTGLETAWKLPGRFCGIGSNPRAVLAPPLLLAPGGSCAPVEEGVRGEDFKIQGARGMLRVQAVGDARQFVSFEAWGPEVRGSDATGKPLWHYAGGQGVDDVWCADLDGDGRDEVIVGYNGNSGLHVLGPDGTLRWKTTEIANVWHVCAGRIGDEKEPRVVATSAAGKVHVFDARGALVQTLDAGIYANMVRVGEGAIFVGGSGEDHLEIRALDAQGQVKWKTEAGASSGHVDAMQVRPDGGLLAASLRGGRVIVVNTATGAIVAEARGMAPRSEIAWVSRLADHSWLLMATTPDGVRGFAISH